MRSAPRPADDRRDRIVEQQREKDEIEAVPQHHSLRRAGKVDGTPQDIGDALRRRSAGKELQKDSKHQCQKPHQPSAHSAKA